MKISFTLKILFVMFSYGCSKSSEQISPQQLCVNAQMKLYDQAELGSQQRKYFDSAFKNKDAYNAWAWRECMKK